MASNGAAPPTKRPHVVLVASPGAGHLIPMAELARRLVAHHGLAATLVTFSNPSSPDAHSAVLSSLSSADVSAAALPPVSLDDLPAGTSIPIVLLELIRRSIPHLRALLHDIASDAHIAALVPDLFAAAVLPLATELGVPEYVFLPSNLTFLAVARSALEHHEDAAAGEYHDLPDPLRLPGRVSLCRADLPDGLRDSREPVFAQAIEGGRQYRATAGYLVNTFYELEPDMVDEFKQAVEQGRFPPVYPVGPSVRSNEDSAALPCLDWLDRQPTGSVVYISFGSQGVLSPEQTAELAAGLEDSGHRFLWVVRMPRKEGGAISSDTGSGDEDDPRAWLPGGFLDRTSGRGLVVTSWAPQVCVLSHPATAGFVSHCGWNSTLESVVAGVPMVAWPLYAEQRMNAVILSENVGVALRPRVRTDGLVPREEVAAAVRELMEGPQGHAVRRQAQNLQQAAARASSPAEGSSWRALEEVAGQWKAAALRKQ